MFPSQTKRAKMVPILYPATFLEENLKRKRDPPSSTHNDACLMKYFPKYYKNLYFQRDCLTRAAQSKVKRLKIVKHCRGFGIPLSDEKIFKKLFLTSRKSFKTIPVADEYLYHYTSDQNFSLCLYFPRVKTLDLEEKCKRPDDWFYNEEDLEEIEPPRLTQKMVYRSYGYFWNGNRCVERLKVDSRALGILKKLDVSKRFLGKLKILQLNITAGVDNYNIPKDLTMELMTYKNFLSHVTCLEVANRIYDPILWERLQLLIKCCPRVHFLSFSTGSEVLSQDFSLDLRHLQNLKVLRINIEHLRTLINGTNFPSSLLEIFITVQGSRGRESFNEFFDCQEDGEDQDVSDWKSFEKFKILSSFFDKWRELNNLKVLKLNFETFLEADLLIRDFVIPLLGAVPQLETFCFELRGMSFEEREQCQEEFSYSRLFDLGVLLSGLNSLRSLRKLQIQIDHGYYCDCVFYGLYENFSQKLLCFPNLSSLQIVIPGSSHFDFKKFFNLFLGPDRRQCGNKKLDLRKISLYCAKDFIKLLNLMHAVSSLKNLQVDLEIALLVENLDELKSSFKYPLCIPNNTRLVVDFEIRNIANELTLEQREYFGMVFGKLQFTVSKSTRSKYGENSFYSYRTVLMKSKLVHRES